MAVITISVKEYGPWFISGVPRQIALDANVPSIIYYTLDGSQPGPTSSIYIEPITLPTSGTIHVRALAISGSDRGALDLLFYSDSSKLFFPRRSNYTGGKGIVVDAYGVETVVTDGYGLNAYNYVILPVRSSDYELDDLEVKYSKEGDYFVGPGVMFRMGIPPEEFWQDDAVDAEPSSPNDDNVFFNPRSLYIVIDGRDGYEDQSVYPINRPWEGTTDMVKYLQGKSFYRPGPYISGGFIKSFYNKDTGTAVSYYFDHNELRWIKSIQNYDPATVPERLGARNLSGGPIVFKWIYNKRSSI
jgi:hypothetical protein